MAGGCTPTSVRTQTHASIWSGRCTVVAGSNVESARENGESGTICAGFGGRTSTAYSSSSALRSPGRCVSTRFGKTRVALGGYEKRAVGRTDGAGRKTVGRKRERERTQTTNTLGYRCALLYHCSHRRLRVTLANSTTAAARERNLGGGASTSPTEGARRHRHRSANRDSGHCRLRSATFIRAARLPARNNNAYVIFFSLFRV